MKKINLLMMLLAAAAMAFTSCSKAEVSAEEPVISGETVVFHITAAAPQTKTVFGGKVDDAYPTTWTTNKQVKFSLNDTKTGVDVTPSAAGASAEFAPEFTGAASSGTIYGFSPVGDFSSDPKIPGFTGFKTSGDYIYLYIPAKQTPLAGSVDESAQALFASAAYDKSAGTAVSMSFNHIVAYGKMTITNFLGTIKSVELQFPENVVGQSCTYAYKIGELSAKSGKSITLNPTNVEGNTFWFALAPTAGTTGTMKIIITDNNDDTYTKTLDLTTKALPFTAGKVSAFTANFNGIAKDDKPAAVYTISTIASNNSWESGKAYNISEDDKGSGDLSLKYGGGGNNGKYYSSDNTWRFYSGGSMTVAAKTGFVISKIVLTTNKGSFSSTGYDSDTNTWTGASYSVTFTTTETTQIQSIQVWYDPICSTPVVSYDHPNVSIECATDGAKIYYTTDGNTPTSTSSEYSAPFPIYETTTVKAIAIKDGYVNSEMASRQCVYAEQYTITISESILHGTVTSDPVGKASEGDEVTLTPSPDPGYVFFSWTVTDAASNPVDVTDNKFIMPKSAVTVSAVFKEIDYSVVYTSNVTFQKGDGNSYLEQVKISGVCYDALRVAKGSGSGSGTFSVPAGTTKIHIHVVGWNGQTSAPSFSSNVGTLTATISPFHDDSGVSSSSPYTLTGTASDYYYELTLSGATSPATITMSASSGKRAVLFGVNAE